MPTENTADLGPGPQADRSIQVLPLALSGINDQPKKCNLGNGPEHCHYGDTKNHSPPPFENNVTSKGPKRVEIHQTKNMYSCYCSYVFIYRQYERLTPLILTNKQT